MSVDNDGKIVDSWHKNVSPWISAVREGEIESRERVTNRAIVETVSSLSPKTVLDVGCGEGWLIRKLAAGGIRGLGTDVVPGLIASASAAGGGEFQVASYDDIASGSLGRKFDAVVCNFSLLGKESVERLIGAASNLLSPHGALVIQTLHPVIACGDSQYLDGWREGSWDGFSSRFIDPAPWYFRTIESWLKLFMNSGLRLVRIREPISPATQKPASIIFVLNRGNEVSKEQRGLAVPGGPT